MKVNSLWIFRASLVFMFISAMLFFGVFYKYHLQYLEGMQLFLYTRSYLIETVAQPGGVVNYMSRFFIQFYHIPMIGGTIIAFLLTILSLGLARIINCVKQGEKQAMLVLAVIPAQLYWIYFCNENYSLAGLVALNVVVWIAPFYQTVKNRWSRALFVVICIPVVWFAVGGAAVVLPFLFIFFELSKREYRNFIAVTATIVISFLVILFSSRIAGQLDDMLLFFGATYFRYMHTPLIPFIALWSLIIIIPLLIHLLPEWRRPWIALLLTTFVIAIGIYSVTARYEGVHEKEYAYLFMAKNMEWNAIISKSYNNLPNSIVAVNMLNLALAVTDRSGDILFDFPQPDQDMLILDEKRDMLFAGEVLFNIGLINEAQRYAFESMVKIPDRQKGAFFILRLAETNLIAGRKEVAIRYLKTLQKTLFYRKKATRLLTMLETDGGVDTHPLYGSIRALQPVRDFNFSALGFEKALKSLLEDNPRNRVAYNYLMMKFMLDRNMPAVVQYMRVVKPLPRHYRQILLMVHGDDIGYQSLLSELGIDNAMKKDFEQFNNLLMGLDFESLKQEFGNRYWFYYNLN